MCVVIAVVAVAVAVAAVVVVVVVVVPFWPLMRFRPSTLIRYICVYVLIHFQERFQIDAFSIKTLSVLVHVDRRPERIEIYASSTGPYTISPLCSVRLKKIPNFEWIKVLCGRSTKRKLS